MWLTLHGLSTSRDARVPGTMESYKYLVKHAAQFVSASVLLSLVLLKPLAPGLQVSSLLDDFTVPNSGRAGDLAEAQLCRPGNAQAACFGCHQSDNRARHHIHFL